MLLCSHFPGSLTDDNLSLLHRKMQVPLSPNEQRHINEADGHYHATWTPTPLRESQDESGVRTIHLVTGVHGHL